MTEKVTRREGGPLRETNDSVEGTIFLNYLSEEIESGLNTAGLMAVIVAEVRRWIENFYSMSSSAGVLSVDEFE
jgi:hypothetical protein